MNKFTSQTEMIEFLRGIPKTADFAALLNDDFGVSDVPKNADPFLKEYFYKYLVQGTYLGLDGTELVDYAKRNVYSFEQKYPWVAHAEMLQTPVSASTPAKTKPAATKNGKVRQNHPNGAVVFLEHRQVWVAYAEGRIVTTQKTEAKAREVLTTKWGF
jgi:hypothetical protein